MPSALHNLLSINQHHCAASRHLPSQDTSSHRPLSFHNQRQQHVQGGPHRLVELLV